MSQKNTNQLLNDFLSFGPDTQNETPIPTRDDRGDLNDRILRIVRSLKELGERIDRLSERM